MNTIKLEGLTKYQVEMLDVMWMLKTQQEYEDWLSLLCEEDFIMAKCLASMIAQECMEDEVVQSDFKESSQVLAKVMAK